MPRARAVAKERPRSNVDQKKSRADAGDCTRHAAATHIAASPGGHATATMRPEAQPSRIAPSTARRSTSPSAKIHGHSWPGSASGPGCGTSSETVVALTSREPNGIRSDGENRRSLGHDEGRSSVPPRNTWAWVKTFPARPVASSPAGDENQNTRSSPGHGAGVHAMRRCSRPRSSAEGYCGTGTVASMRVGTCSVSLRTSSSVNLAERCPTLHPPRPPGTANDAYVSRSTGPIMTATCSAPRRA